MWLRCRRCLRITLCLDPVAASPHLCGACRETHPGWRPRGGPAAAVEDRRGVVELGGFLDRARASADIVIDVTPA